MPVTKRQTGKDENGHLIRKQTEVRNPERDIEKDRDVFIARYHGNRENLSAQRGARTHDPEIKSLMLYRLS